MKADSIPVPSVTSRAQLVKAQLYQLACDAPRRRTERHPGQALLSNPLDPRERRFDVTKSLQETFAPAGCCFGCGPKNDRGLRIRSVPLRHAPDAHVVCDFIPTAAHRDAFEAVLDGAILGTILDCHMSWTAVFHHLLKTTDPERVPRCVTAELKIVLKRPTVFGPMHIDAQVVSSSEGRAKVEATITAAGNVTAFSTGTFVTATSP